MEDSCPCVMYTNIGIFCSNWCNCWVVTGKKFYFVEKVTQNMVLVVVKFLRMVYNAISYVILSFQ